MASLGMRNHAQDHHQGEIRKALIITRADIEEDFAARRKTNARC